MSYITSETFWLFHQFFIFQCLIQFVAKTTDVNKENVDTLLTKFRQKLIIQIICSTSCIHSCYWNITRIFLYFSLHWFHEMKEVDQQPYLCLTSLCLREKFVDFHLYLLDCELHLSLACAETEKGSELQIE